jgi:phenylalanyl-tRNA synthetase beta chain
LLIQEVAGGEITSDIVDIYPKKIEDFSCFLHFNKVNKFIGEEIPNQKRLKRFSFIRYQS